MSRRWLFGAGAATAVAALLVTSSPAAATAAVPNGAGPAATPAKLSNKLLSAWLRRDRAAAAKVATPAAVKSIFSYAYRAPDEFAGCVGNACRFVHTSVRVPGGLNGLLMIVSGSKVTTVYQSRHVTKPAVVAKHLLTAWQKGDRNRGLEVASQKTVARLFRVKYDPKGVTYYFQGCTKEAKGYSCAYSYDGGALFMNLKGSVTRGYDVQSIGYIAD